MNNIDNNNKIKENYFKNYYIYLILLNSIFYISFTIVYSKQEKFNPISNEITELKVGEGKTAKIGIISDIQLEKGGHDKDLDFHIFEDNLITALKVLKKNDIDILIIAGDITNTGEAIDYLLFKKIFELVYNDNIKKPKVISIMGNHDYYSTKISKNQNQKKFFKIMKSYPYSHFIINKYNFIFWSNDNYYYDDEGIEDYTWIKSALETAKKNINKKGDPIFVVTHIPPKPTVYGSESSWGSIGIFDILKNYPEVICLSGHSHYSLRNIKSIWQGEFTVINTQSISYVDLDDSYANANEVRKDSAKNDSIGLIASLNEENVIFNRIEFSTEEIVDESWEIKFPINISEFRYTFDKRNKKIKPVFTDSNGIKIEKKNINKKNRNFIVFNAASHEDYIYFYKIIFKQKDNYYFTKEYLYLSDYYRNKKLRKKILKFELPTDLNGNQYDVEIYAVDSFNNISNPKKGVIEI